MLKVRNGTPTAGYVQARWQMVRHGSVGQGTALFGRVSFGAARFGTARLVADRLGMARLHREWRCWVRCR